MGAPSRSVARGHALSWSITTPSYPMHEPHERAAKGIARTIATGHAAAVAMRRAVHGRAGAGLLSGARPSVMGAWYWA